MASRWAIPAAFALLIAGCEAAPRTRVELDATQEREVEAAPDRAYSAASGAVMDAGYTMDVSDADGGLLSGHKLFEHSIALKVAVAIMTRGSGTVPPDLLTVCIQVRDIGNGRSAVRAQTYLNGSAELDHKAIDDLWVLMQRQVLMKELPRAGPPGLSSR
jgi:hypothetical protein